MYVVHGNPAFTGSFVAAMINVSGRYEGKLKYRFDGDGDQYGCTAHAVEKATGETIEGPKVTWEIVKKERWNQKDGSKWKTIPDLMFTYRAAAWFGRRHDPDLLVGMLTVEEAQDIVDLKQQPTGSYEVEGKPEGISLDNKDLYDGLATRAAGVSDDTQQNTETTDTSNDC